MTKAVELENLLTDFATDLTDEDMKEIERVFETMTLVHFIRGLR